MDASIPNSSTILLPLEALQAQEEKFYHCRDYLLQDSMDCSTSCNPQLLDANELSLNRSFREIMVNWSYQILDLADCQRETAEYALSYFDRYLQTAHGAQALRQRPVFQLVFVTSLYLAIKIHESITMTPGVFSKLSRSAYTKGQIEDMEMSLLQSLQWRMNPPTSMTFVRQILALVSIEILPVTMRLTVYYLAKAQMDMVLQDYRFVSVKKSVLAMAGILNALESLKYSLDFGYELIERAGMVEFEDDIADLRSEVYHMLANRLHHGVSGGVNNGDLLSMSSCQDIDNYVQRVSYETSPRSVFS